MAHVLSAPSPLLRVKRKVEARRAQHRDNLELWRTGYLNPSEPDADERRKIMARLRAAIAEDDVILAMVQEAVWTIQEGQ